MFWKKLELVQKQKLKFQNNLKKKILVISGGVSKERSISLDTGKQVSKELIKNNYNVKITEPNFKMLNVIKTFKPQIIFNALIGGQTAC